MIEPTTPTKQSSDKNSKKVYHFPAWALIALVLAAITAFFIVPLVIPGLLQRLSGPDSNVYWYLSRASAFVAYILVWVSMLAGLAITSKAGRRWPGLPSSFELHKFTGLLGLGFAAIHVLTLLGDQYIGWSFVQLAVPFMASGYKTQWVGVGQIAIYLTCLVSFTYYIRNKIGVRTWRMIHALSFALFLMTLIHSVESGTDTANWWATDIYWASAITVALGSIYRVIAAKIGHGRQAAATTGLLATAGKVQAQPAKNNYELRVTNYGQR